MSEAGPPVKLLVRTPNKISLFHGLPAPESGGPFTDVPASTVEFTADGSRFAAVFEDRIAIHDTATEAKVGEILVACAIAVAWSPAGAYLQTFERPNKELGNAYKNLKLWRVDTKELVLQLFQRNFSKEAWPSLQLPSDESVVAHANPNVVNFYDPTDTTAGILKRRVLKGVGGVALSPVGHVLAAWVPEAKGVPGFVGLWDHRQLTSAGDAPTALSRKSFFRANSVRLMWNALGTAVLAETASDTDATNQSYYGETKLHFLAVDGHHESLASLKEGPVHDVAWSPTGSHFIVIAGFMPAKTVLFDAKCTPIYDLGSGPHNTVRWSPHGRFVAIAGFGNLPGDLVFYEKKADGKCKKVGTTRVENGVTCGWAPDGRHFVTATTAPRLRVDNAFYVYKYNGLLLHKKEFFMLSGADWVPAPAEAYHDRPPSPRTTNGAAAAADSGAAALPPQPPARAAGYVPPNRRAAGQGPTDAGLSSAQFSLAYERHERVGKISAVNASHKTLVPGAGSIQSKAASKNAAKRRNRKGKAGAGGGAEGEADGEPDGDGVSAVESGVAVVSLSTDEAQTAPSQSSPAANGSAAPQASNGAVSTAAGTSMDAGSDAAKKLRTLQKKLRQVQQLKERRDKEGAGALDADQLNKVAGEGDLLAEIAALGG